MKYTALISLLLVVSLHAGADTPWEQYFADPTPAHAALVGSIAYSPGRLPPNYGYDPQHLQVLETQVVAGDRDAFRLVNRAMASADGALLEQLTVIASRITRGHPELFLGEAAQLGLSSHRLEDILLTTGPEYTDLPVAHRYELQMRQKALASVSRADLNTIKGRCIEILSHGT